MYKKALCVFFALLLAWVIFGNQSARATVNFPNTSIFATNTFSLDLDGNGELVTIMRYQNLDNDFELNSSTTLDIPIRITSFSEEELNLTACRFGDNAIIECSIRNYTISPRQSDSTYIHEYVIELSYKNARGYNFLNNQIITIRITTKIDGISSDMGNYSKFIYNILPITNKNVQSYIIRVNLPNDPYYWTEILDTYPTYEYRGSFGNGQSVEWRYAKNSNIFSPILIDYRVHPDPIRKELDDLSVRSYFITVIAFVLGIIAIRKDIKELWQWLKQKLFDNSNR